MNSCNGLYDCAVLGGAAAMAFIIVLVSIIGMILILKGAWILFKKDRK